MLLSPGTRLGSYEIVASIGAGGMGEVYKARDSRLDRFVAIKVLPARRLSDPDRKRRFVQEAKSASALNHPNIVTIHEIGEQDGIDYIVMEFVDGQTLDRLIPRTGLRLSEALKIAIQIADGLSRAHAAGIVHRDLKPGNVMVASSGLVKILDFGLAKLVDSNDANPRGGPFDDTRTVADAPLSQEGAIAGTAAYMSPEQAEGRKLDARSDIFSFGAVLYEMVTGRRAFQGDTPMSTLSAVIKEEPKPPSHVATDIPRDLEKIINRCLRKDLERRASSMTDVRIALLELKEESESGTLAPSVSSSKPKSSRRSLYAGAGLLLAVSAAALWFIRRPAPSPAPEPLIVTFSAVAGRQATPSFSPDGNQIAYAWSGEDDDNFDIYVKVIGTETPLRITTDPAPDTSPTWSPDGRWIAFVRQTGPRDFSLYRISPLGGAERKIGEIVTVPALGHATQVISTRIEWTPDGKWILTNSTFAEATPSRIVLISVETGEIRKLTSSEGFGDSGATLSKDQQKLAFLHQVNDSRTTLLVLDLDNQMNPVGSPRQIASAGDLCRSVRWTADGKDLLVSTQPTGTTGGTGRTLRISLSRDSQPREVPLLASAGSSLAVSQQGNRVAYVSGFSNTNIWRMEVSGPGGRPGEFRPFISSTRSNSAPALSPDGTRLLFDSTRSGSNGVWLVGADGKNPAPLMVQPGTLNGSAQWSPDGKRIAFDSRRDKHAEIYLMSPEGGAAKAFTNHPADEMMAAWSKDGNWIYFTSNRSGRFEVWKMPSTGGAAVQLTRNGGFTSKESADGKFIYYERARESQTSLWKMPVDGGEETRVLDSVLFRGWTVVEQGIWFITTDPDGRHLKFLNFSTGKINTIAAVPRPIGFGFTASPDGRTLLLPQIQSQGTEILLVENFF